MSKRKREETNDKDLHHDDICNQIFCNDILVEIFSFFNNDFNFVVMNCALVCKQWFNAILSSERLNLYLNCSPKMKPQGRFLSKISTLVVIRRENIHELFNAISLMTQLTSLDIHYNNINIEGAQCISELKQLTELRISCNEIDSEGDSEMKHINNLHDLALYACILKSEGFKYFSELKQLTYLNIGQCSVDDLGEQYLSNLKQLAKLI